MNSLTQAGKDKVHIWSDQFILNGRESGILPLKVIIRESHLDTNVTEFRKPLQVQSHLEMPRILVQLGHIQRT